MSNDRGHRGGRAGLTRARRSVFRVRRRGRHPHTVWPHARVLRRLPQPTLLLARYQKLVVAGTL